MAVEMLVTGKPQGHAHERRGIIAKPGAEESLLKKPGSILTEL
jgi:hypothetical protein